MTGPRLAGSNSHRHSISCQLEGQSLKSEARNFVLRSCSVGDKSSITDSYCPLMVQMIETRGSCCFPSCFTALGCASCTLVRASSDYLDRTCHFDFVNCSYITITAFVAGSAVINYCIELDSTVGIRTFKNSAAESITFVGRWPWLV